MHGPTGLDGPSSSETNRDLFFTCEHCGIPLVVDRAAAGMTLNCQRCGKPTSVPAGSKQPATLEGAPAAPAGEAAELQHHLKENESQRTEITGYINQINIQLHRWQLRLQTLNERNAELKAAIAAARNPPAP